MEAVFYICEPVELQEWHFRVMPTHENKDYSRQDRKSRNEDVVYRRAKQTEHLEVQGVIDPLMKSLCLFRLTLADSFGHLCLHITLSSEKMGRFRQELELLKLVRLHMALEWSKLLRDRERLGRGFSRSASPAYVHTPCGVGCTTQFDCTKVVDLSRTLTSSLNATKHLSSSTSKSTHFRGSYDEIPSIPEAITTFDQDVDQRTSRVRNVNSMMVSYCNACADLKFSTSPVKHHTCCQSKIIEIDEWIQALKSWDQRDSQGQQVAIASKTEIPPNTCRRQHGMKIIEEHHRFGDVVKRDRKEVDDKMDLANCSVESARSKSPLMETETNNIALTSSNSSGSQRARPIITHAPSQQAQGEPSRSRSSQAQSSGRSSGAGKTPQRSFQKDNGDNGSGRGNEPGGNEEVKQLEEVSKQDMFVCVYRAHDPSKCQIYHLGNMSRVLQHITMRKRCGRLIHEEELKRLSEEQYRELMNGFPVNTRGKGKEKDEQKYRWLYNIFFPGEILDSARMYCSAYIMEDSRQSQEIISQKAYELLLYLGEDVAERFKENFDPFLREELQQLTAKRSKVAIGASSSCHKDLIPLQRASSTHRTNSVNETDSAYCSSPHGQSDNMPALQHNLTGESASSHSPYDQQALNNAQASDLNHLRVPTAEMPEQDPSNWNNYGGDVSETDENSGEISKLVGDGSRDELLDFDMTTYDYEFAEFL